MELWLKTSLLLCSYGFFKEIRPSESFLTEYLLGPQQNLTESQVYYDIYPVWTYSYVSLLILVFLVTDLLRYKPVIVLEGLGYIITWVLLLWARGVPAMQGMQFAYGVACSTEVAYYTYIYAKVSQEHYQRVTSYTRTAILLGRFASGLMAQLLTMYDVLDYYTLNYVSLTCVSIAFVIGCCLPSVEHSIYFNRKEDGNEENQQNTDNKSFLEKVKKVGNLIWTDFKKAYSSSYLVKWSLWWAAATAINYQAGNYIQPLYESIAPMDETETLYNGAVDATTTLLGALTTLGVGYLNLNWHLLGEPIMALMSLVDCLLLLAMGLTHNIWVAYIGYIIFRVSYQVLITIASFQVARELQAESYGLVFGINMFFGLLIESILTVVIIEALEVEPEPQFVIYGCYFGILSLVFIIFSGVTFLRLGWSGIKSQGLWEERPPPEHDQAEQDQAVLSQSTNNLI